MNIEVLLISGLLGDGERTKKSKLMSRSAPGTPGSEASLRSAAKGCLVCVRACEATDEMPWTNPVGLAHAAAAQTSASPAAGAARCTVDCAVSIGTANMQSSVYSFKAQALVKVERQNPAELVECWNKTETTP